MKKSIIYLLAIILGITTSCSVNSDDNQDLQNYKSLWHLRNVSGGVSGVNDDFELETIVWSFDETTATLTVENNNTDDTKEDALDSGTYSYSLAQVASRNYLSIDGTEVGELTFSSQNTMVIDENELSTGSASDGFKYTFQRTLVAE
ncbi:hypothetical protein [Aestuariivivens insulae]|uniref:hypothetical protein n=1 Tax=Aestuariivivens insulae TaxID=1621988 RepID=UPI001F56E53F|nr:hypothetical protein [Aestuariivivens insulae]